MLIKMYKFIISWYVPVYVHCIYSQSISCRPSLSLFSLSNCIMFLFDTTILSESMNMSYHYHYYPVWWVLSVLAVLLWLFDVLHTSIVHDFWCPRQTQHLRFETSFRMEDHTDWERAPPSYDLQSWGSLVWIQIWEFFTPMNHVKQLSQFE